METNRESIVYAIKSYAETAHHRATMTAYIQEGGSNTNGFKAARSSSFERAQEATGEFNGACNVLSQLFCCDFWLETDWKPLFPYDSPDGRRYFPASFATLDKVTIHWLDGKTEVVFEA